MASSSLHLQLYSAKPSLWSSRHRSIPSAIFQTKRNPPLTPPNLRLEAVNGFRDDEIQDRSTKKILAQATDNNQDVKTSSIVCANCDGNGAVLCSQCKGSGVNSIDHFNGQFKAGQLCWLCRGKNEILCGNCNGAGFTGGFMSTFDE
ncbi:unnamed protein product [Cuscuta campestris]|uniref:BSD2 cysteine rich domain-containing protein n=1 Tax=Cuscuta campestris TaxID=132261 RepID=A0A484LMI4_9ASTE|nr:unnamed protein product [Cuscuta campestris]